MGNSILKFQDLCRKFETLLRNEYDLEDKESAFKYLEKLEEFKEFREEINTIRNLRNFLFHRNYKINKKAMIISISEQLCDSFKEIIKRIENPILVKDKYIKDIYSTNLKERIERLIKIMKEKNISHVPILDERKKLTGVFSENTIFLKLTKDEIIGIDPEHIVEDYLEYTDIKNHSYEYFDFIPINAKLTKAKKLFSNSIKGDKKLAMLFVTKHGKENQEILGILTPWDVL